MFAKALLSRSATCGCCARLDAGEQVHVLCHSPVAQARCAELAALMHERARFALRLPAAGQPLLHVQALRLQCGGLAAVGHLVDHGHHDVARHVEEALRRFGHLGDLPWSELVDAIRSWVPPRRRGGR